MPRFVLCLAPSLVAVSLVALSLIAASPIALALPAAADPLPARYRAPVAPGGPDARLFDEAVLVLVNRERVKAGLRPLAGDRGLRRLSARQAGAMAQARLMSHRLTAAKSARLAGRLDAEGLRYRRAGENIAMDKVYRLLGRPISARIAGCAFTYADDGAAVPVHSHASLAQSVVARWMASPGHRANILAPQFRRTGAGAALDLGGPACGDVYLAQAFTD